MREHIESCRTGETGFADFVKATMPYWRCVAGDLLSRWDAPAAVEEEDLVQELLLAAWRAIETADPAKGDVRRRVVWCAVKTARRWLHRQRGAYGFARCKRGADSSSRFPTPADWVDKVPEDRPGGAAQEQAAELMRSMRLARTRQDREVLEAFLRAPSVDIVAEKLYGDPKKRMEMRFSSGNGARCSVRRTVNRIAKRAAAR